MRQLLFLFSIMVGLSLTAQGQVRVGNVRFTFNADGMIVAQYDVQGIAADDSVYLAANGLKSGRLTPLTITGDAGRKVAAGTGKTIYWDIVKDGYKIDEDMVVTVLIKLARGRLPQSAPTVGSAGGMRPVAPVAIAQPDAEGTPTKVTPSKQTPVQPDPVKTEAPRTARTEPPKSVEIKNLEVEPAPKKEEKVAIAKPVPAKPAPAKPESQVKKGGGPVNALLSALAPGVGNIFVQPDHKIGARPAATVAYLGLLIYGISQHSASQKAYTEYKALPQFTEQTTADAAYSKANNANHTAIVCVAGAAAIWAVDVTFTLLRGLKNQRENSTASQPPRTQFSVATLGKTPVITFRYSF